ncbi:hypothetical protein [Alteromonas confluentis]|uniref:Uncharacterized protein n=1 Tax=Alteromonas confluentis TaxID=1656094 RepID=A0A1E7Z889_9ALTE|nr:hypothetical protein [Alteromonas confluentis]OFC69740.1 hypothetical protein BFC18_16880 [Alteromonas confluentis]
MQKYDFLRTMKLKAPVNTDLSSVYGHSVNTFSPLSDRLAKFAGSPVSHRKARRWAAMAQTNRVLNAL